VLIKTYVLGINLTGVLGVNFTQTCAGYGLSPPVPFPHAAPKRKSWRRPRCWLTLAVLAFLVFPSPIQFQLLDFILQTRGIIKFYQCIYREANWQTDGRQGAKCKRYSVMREGRIINDGTQRGSVVLIQRLQLWSING